MKISSVYGGTVYKNTEWGIPGMGAAHKKPQKYSRLSKA